MAVTPGLKAAAGIKKGDSMTVQRKLWADWKGLDEEEKSKKTMEAKEMAGGGNEKAANVMRSKGGGDVAGASKPVNQRTPKTAAEKEDQRQRLTEKLRNRLDVINSKWGEVLDAKDLIQSQLKQGNTLVDTKKKRKSPWEYKDAIEGFKAQQKMEERQKSGGSDFIQRKKLNQKQRDALSTQLNQLDSIAAGYKEKSDRILARARVVNR